MFCRAFVILRLRSAAPFKLLPAAPTCPSVSTIALSILHTKRSFLQLEKSRLAVKHLVNFFTAMSHKLLHLQKVLVQSSNALFEPIDFIASSSNY